MIKADTPVRARAAAIRDGVLNEKVTKVAYDKGMNLSRYLESLDPSDAHTNPQSDAFNRVLASCGIRTRSVPELGIAASCLEDVVEHPQARHLALEIFARAYRGVLGGAKTRTPMGSQDSLLGSFANQYAFPGVRPASGLLAPAVGLSELVGQTTGINQSYYRPFYLEDVSNVTSRVGEMAEVPAVKIATSEKTITLQKYGRRLDVSYEAIRRIPIDLLGFYVQRIAVKVEAEKVDKVLGIIVAGDGTSGTAATNYNVSDLNGAASGTTFNLEAWLAFKMKFKNPMMMTTVIGTDANALKLMLLDSGSANVPLASLPVLGGAGNLTTINQGLADGVRLGWLDAAPAGKLVAIDKRFAIERIFEAGAAIQETATDVKSQINTLVLTEVEGYAILDPLANKTLDLTA